MQDTTTPIIEIVEELAAELRHADALITHQEEHIQALEAEIALLRNLLGPVAA
jgi:ABC-type methionine transport system ATPase subunit